MLDQQTTSLKLYMFKIHAIIFCNFGCIFTKQPHCLPRRFHKPHQTTYRLRQPIRSNGVAELGVSLLIALVFRKYLNNNTAINMRIYFSLINVIQAIALLNIHDLCLTSFRIKNKYIRAFLAHMTCAYFPRRSS